MFPLQREWVSYLVREVRSHKPQGSGWEGRVGEGDKIKTRGKVMSTSLTWQVQCQGQNEIMNNLTCRNWQGWASSGSCNIYECVTLHSILYNILTYAPFFPPSKAGALGLISLLKIYKTSQTVSVASPASSDPSGGRWLILPNSPGKGYQEETLSQRGLSLLNMCSELVVWRYRDRPGKGLQKPWKEHSWRSQAWARILGWFYPVCLWSVCRNLKVLSVPAT